MLATRPTRESRAHAAVVLAFLLLGVAMAFVPPTVRGDVPQLSDNGDGSKTLSWSMNRAEGLSLADLEMSNGSVSLPWRPANMTWDRASQFAANASGPPDPNLSFGTEGVVLRPDSSNYVASGGFASPAPWSFESSGPGNVTAGWSQTLEFAVLRHSSSVGWDDMDSMSNWVGLQGTTWVNSTDPRQGAGMLGLNFSLGSAPSFAGVQRAAPVNWSMYDRLIAWIFIADVGSALTLNVTAYSGASLRATNPISVNPGWQEVVVNLSELGSPRDSLVSATLRLNGANVALTTAYFDDLRLGSARTFNETAHVHQAFGKAVSTPDLPGSGELRFRWERPDGFGIGRATAEVEVTGPSGTARYPIVGAGPGWQTFAVDISATTALPGSYAVTFAFQVVVNDAAASSELRVDDVSVLFPNRRDATYVSNAVSLGIGSEFLSVNWLADTPAQTSVLLSLRSGNDSNPGSSTWSDWSRWTDGGAYPASIPPAAFVQIRADLQTTNASVGPTLRGFDLSARHRASYGTVMSGTVNTGSLKPWRELRWAGDAPAGSLITFFIGDGTYFQPVSSDGDLTEMTSHSTVRWSATLSTTDGLRTPTLVEVEFLYEVAVPAADPPWLVAFSNLMPYSVAVPAAGVLGYLGYQLIARRLFSIDDVFLISKDGRLLMHNTRRMRADRDEDIFSGMLTAILAFLRDSDPEENGELHRFQIGGKTTLLERGAYAYLVAVYSGRVPRWAGKDLSRFMKSLESEFGKVLVRWTGDPEDLQGLKEFTKRFVSRTRYRPPRWANGRAA